jgi:hypothetical protein
MELRRACLRGSSLKARGNLDLDSGFPSVLQGAQIHSRALLLYQHLSQGPCRLSSPYAHVCSRQQLQLLVFNSAFRRLCIRLV